MHIRRIGVGFVVAAAIAACAVAGLYASGSVTTQIQLKVTATGSKTTGLATSTDPVSQDYTVNLSSGTGANQASNIYHAQRTLTASATEDLDLAGTLTNAFGVTLTFTKVKAIIIKAAAANTNNVEVTRPALNGVPLFMAASDGISLTPGALVMAEFPDANGKAVTAGTGDLLTFTNSAGGTSVTYDVIIIGVD